MPRQLTRLYWGAGEGADGTRAGGNERGENRRVARLRRPMEPPELVPSSVNMQEDLLDAMVSEASHSLLVYAHCSVFPVECRLVLGYQLIRSSSAECNQLVFQPVSDA